MISLRLNKAVNLRKITPTCALIWSNLIFSHFTCNFFSLFFSGEEVHFMHICESSTDQTPINELLQLSGVKQVSFPKDTRIIDVWWLKYKKVPMCSENWDGFFLRIIQNVCMCYMYHHILQSLDICYFKGKYTYSLFCSCPRAIEGFRGKPCFFSLWVISSCFFSTKAKLLFT